MIDFGSLQLAIDSNFWTLLREKKLNDIKLESNLIKINAQTSILNRFDKKRETFFSINEKAFKEAKENNLGIIGYEGELKVFNKISEIENMEWEKVMETNKTKLLNSFNAGECIFNPKLFFPFQIFCYPDIKNYIFYYKAILPILKSDIPLFGFNDSDTKSNNIKYSFSPIEIKVIKDRIQKLRVEELDNEFSGFFILKVTGQKDESTNRDIEMSYLKDINQYFLTTKADNQVYLGFMDPCNGDNPSILLNNILYYFSTLDIKNLNVLCIKQTNIKNIEEHSQVFQIKFKQALDANEIHLTNYITEDKLEEINLTKSMNPLERLRTSVDLNLKLMKWRAEPALDLDIIANSRCLLFGVGTLGCEVAKLLLAWNVKNITLVDNGKVSYSNPVRQCLYTFEHAEKGEFKTVAAVERLKEINPHCNAIGHQINIPMPGHAPSLVEMEKIKKDVALIEKLISENDIIFMLTDSRESRWLPTMLTNKHNKILINVALAYDSLMVMRHGMKEEHDNINHLSCYFCQDVVVPTDSLTDRTHDEQCTVTRPGLAPIAGALAVELMVSILQHRKKGLAEAPLTNKKETDTNNEINNRLCEIVPHQMRNYLNSYSQILPTGQSFPQCTACSNHILNAYKTGGFGFLCSVFQDSSILSKITGIDAMLRNMEEWDVDIDSEDGFRSDIEEEIKEENNDLNVNLENKIDEDDKVENDKDLDKSGTENAILQNEKGDIVPPVNKNQDQINVGLNENEQLQPENTTCKEVENDLNEEQENKDRYTSKEKEIEIIDEVNCTPFSYEHLSMENSLNVPENRLNENQHDNNKDEEIGNEQRINNNLEKEETKVQNTKYPLNGQQVEEITPEEKQVDEAITKKQNQGIAVDGNEGKEVATDNIQSEDASFKEEQVSNIAELTDKNINEKNNFEKIIKPIKSKYLTLKKLVESDDEDL